MYKLIFLLVFATNLVAAEEPLRQQRRHEGALTVGEEYSFHSALMTEDQKYTVILPASYATNKSKHYPVVYVLDGYESQLLLASTAMRINYETGPFRAPEAIVIGIPSNNRNRDYTPVHSEVDFLGEKQDWLLVSGGAGKYRDFLKQEFFPHIAAHYRVNTHRIVIGHSFSGLFALSDLLSGDPLFQSYIVIEPSLWFGDDYLMKLAEKLDNELSGFSGNLYAAIALDGATELYKKSDAEILFAIINKKSADAYKGKVEIYADENHSSIVMAGFHAGVRHIFDGYKPPALSEIAQKPEILSQHYDAFSQQIGVRYLPDVWWTNAAAKNAFDHEMVENAQSLYQLNVTNYPELAEARAELARFYESIGELGKAVTVYAEVLKIDPAYKGIIEKIKELAE